jgi:NADH:ubiquinone oxidoreductase subunit 3 (subunit A)
MFVISLNYGYQLKHFMEFACLSLLGASFLTMTAIAVDRYLALLLHMRYRTVVTVRRVSFATCFLWLVSLLGNSFRYILGFTTNNVVILLVFFSCLIISTYCYIQIYRIVRRHRRQIMDRTLSFPAGCVPTARQGKSIKTMYYIHGLFVVCIIPYSIGIGLYLSFGPRPDTVIVMCCVLSILFLNSSINPYFYCWRILEIRRVITSLLNSLKARFSSGCTAVLHLLQDPFVK